MEIPDKTDKKGVLYWRKPEGQSTVRLLIEPDSTVKIEFFVLTVWNLRSEPLIKNSVFGLFAVES